MWYVVQAPGRPSELGGTYVIATCKTQITAEDIAVAMRNTWPRLNFYCTDVLPSEY